MLYVILGHDAPDAREKRPTVRPAHLEHLAPLARAGRIRLAGPLLDRTGSLIILEADSLAEVWGIVARDPFHAGWLFTVLPSGESSTDGLLTAAGYADSLSIGVPAAAKGRS